MGFYYVIVSRETCWPASKANSPSPSGNQAFYTDKIGFSSVKDKPKSCAMQSIHKSNFLGPETMKIEVLWFSSIENSTPKKVSPVVFFGPEVAETLKTAPKLD